MSSRNCFISTSRELARDSATFLSCSISISRLSRSVSKALIFSRRKRKVCVNPSCMSLTFSAKILTSFASTCSAAVFTLDRKVDLHSGHLKRPTRNSGITPYAACLAGDTVQHLMAAGTVAPQLGHLTNV